MCSGAGDPVILVSEESGFPKGAIMRDVILWGPNRKCVGRDSYNFCAGSLTVRVVVGEHHITPEVAGPAMTAGATVRFATAESSMADKYQI